MEKPTILFVQDYDEAVERFLGIELQGRGYRTRSIFYREVDDLPGRKDNILSVITLPAMTDDTLPYVRERVERLFLHCEYKPIGVALDRREVAFFSSRLEKETIDIFFLDSTQDDFIPDLADVIERRVAEKRR